jgi:ribosomal protein S18 acetylase RimI-like enzyme
MSQLNRELSSTGGLSMLPLPAVALLPKGWAPGDGDGGQTVVLTRPLGETQWQMIRTFVGRTDRDDLRLRFGQPLDFTDDATLKRFFDVGGACGEQVWALDDAGDICGILHRVRTSPSAAEIALIVRSDRKRRGFGEQLLRTALARAVEQNLTTLRAYVLGENSAMLRLARKVGFVAQKPAGFSVELEFNLRSAAFLAQMQGGRAHGPARPSPTHA